MINSKIFYKRILLKISGEILQGSEYFGIDPIAVNRIAQEIKEIAQLGIQIGIVIGGGNLFRGYTLNKNGINRVISDQIGMLATIINGLIMQDALYRTYVQSKLMSVIPLLGICENYNWSEAINLMKNNYVVILSSGIGNPFFTTDSAACLRGIEIKADIVMKATKVNGVYSDDPIKNPNAILHEKLTYNEVLEKKLKIMDITAFNLAQDHCLPIKIFNMNKPGTLLRVIMGKKEGTLISNL